MSRPEKTSTNLGVLGASVSFLRSSHLASVPLCAVLAGGLLAAQAPRPQERPTFRVETRAIEVDAFVTDREGAFVRGLTKDDFELLEDGQPQEISAFTLVDVPIDPPPVQQRGQKTKSPIIDTDIVTNTTEGRIYVMLLDSPGLAVPERAHVSLEQMFRYSQREARRFIDESLGPNDLMAVVHAQASRTDAQSFTRNKALLRAAIDRMTPDQAFVGQTSKYCDAPKLRNTYEAIQAVSERLGAVTGRRKAILWFNGRVPLDPSDPDPEEGCGFLAAEGSSLSFMYRDALRAATRHNVAIYPIDPVGLTADPTRKAGEDRAVAETSKQKLFRLAALRAIAEDTGGEAIINTNNFAAGYERVVRANSSYYLLGYRPAIDHRDGKFHAITLRMKRPDLSVRTRKGYTAPGPDAPVESRLLPGVSADAGAALVKAIPANGIGLELFLAPFKGAGNAGSVVLGAELRGVSLDVGPDAILEISYLAVDPQGTARAAPPKKVALTRPDNETDAAAGALRFFDRLTLPVGRHEIRMAVHQPGGATGSVVAYVEVPDFARAPLVMSGLVLTTTGAAPPALLGDARLRGLLSADPTTRRRFARSETLTAFVEVYPEARLKVDDVVTIATLAPARGGTARTVPTSRVGDESGRAGYTVRLRLADVSPGEYVLTLEAKAGRRSALRQLPFTVAD
jgi:VWFA-related protein